MRITDIETIPLEVSLKRTFKGSQYSMSHRATLITRVYTDEGIVGETYNGDEVDTQLEISRIIKDEILDLIVGEDPQLVEAVWETMLPVTFDILRDRKPAVMAMAAVDSALWDIVGKVAQLPLVRLWGGARQHVPIVAIGGYYGGDEADLAREVEEYLELGLAGCKMKVGGALPQVDARRFLAMRKAGGEDFILMADANQGYTLPEALEFCRLIGEEAGLRWFEEPVRWTNDHLGMRDVRFRANVSVAAGQSELSRSGARDLMREGAIDVCNFDASWSGGPTEWRRVAGLAASYGVEMAHHEEPQIASHLVGSVANGTYVECFHPDRDPIFWELIANRPPITDGMYEIPRGPGWGLELDASYIDSHRVDH